MVGSACLSLFQRKGYKNLCYIDSNNLDLRDQKQVYDYLNDERPDLIIDAAAKVGGIVANNTYPYEFLMDNLQIQNNLINAAHKFDVSDFIFLGSSCIYPKLCTQPIKEKYLMTGELEPTNQWYAIAKITGVKLIESLNKEYGRRYLSLMPTNLYGPGDNFNLENSHVIPALIRKLYEARINKNSVVSLWGSGQPLREFLHVQDLARAIHYFSIQSYKHNIYNIGYGKDITIEELSRIIMEVVGYEGDIIWDTTKPDGTPKKLLDCSRMEETGFRVKYDLKNGLKDTFNWFVDNYSDIRQ